MFNRIVESSLRSRLLVLAAALVLVVYGSFVLPRLPVDVFPDLNRPTVVLLSEAEGLAPQEVEQLVTYPIETAMAGIPGAVRVRSASGVGLSIVYVEFGWDTEIYRARQQVAERLAGVQGRLPHGVQPQMGPISSIMGEIMLVAVTGAASPMQLREIADFVIRPQLLTIPGVAQVIPIGGEVRQYRIAPDPVMMSRLEIPLAELEAAVRRFGVNTGGGFVDQHAREYLIRNIGLTDRIEDLRNLVVATRQGHGILLRQVAQVDFAARVKRGDAGYMGNPAVIVGIQKQPTADTVTLTHAIEAQLDSIQRTLPQGITANKIQFRQATFIETSIANVKRVLVEAALVVAVILFLFLMNVRATAISLAAIPISILITVLVFKAFGLSINTMTLGGLAIAIGALVDDAVVAVENILRRLKENGQKPDPAPPLAVIARASQEVRSGILYATFIIILVFVPLFALSGIEGRLFVPLGIAYIVATLASLLTSMTVTPALAYYLLSGAGGPWQRRQLPRSPAQGGQHPAPELGLPPAGHGIFGYCRRCAGGWHRCRAAAARLSAPVQRGHHPRQPAVQPRHLPCRIQSPGRARRAAHHGDSRGQELGAAHRPRRARRACRRRPQLRDRRRSGALRAQQGGGVRPHPRQARRAARVGRHRPADRPSSRSHALGRAGADRRQDFRRGSRYATRLGRAPARAPADGAGARRPAGSRSRC